MKLLKSSIWSFFAVLVRGISALSINKIFAVQFGPSGIALLSHFQNLTTIITTIPNDGVNRGLIRFLSPEDNSIESKKKYFSAGWCRLYSFLVFEVLEGTYGAHFTPVAFVGIGAFVVLGWAQCSAGHD